ncbi:MAG: invasin domain 3-containing protein, partial [Myxococcota bacterium]
MRRFKETKHREPNLSAAVRSVLPIVVLTFFGCSDTLEREEEPPASTNECATGTDTCDPLRSCINLQDGFACGPCPRGTLEEGERCTPFDPCEQSPCFPGVACTDDAPPSLGFSCGSCPPGTEGAGRVCFGREARSPVRSTGSCLTSGAGGRVRIDLELLDATGNPVRGANVEAETSAGALGAVQEANGIYSVELTARQSAALQWSHVRFRADGVEMENTALVLFDAPADPNTPGVGGCFADGNLRVRVLDDRRAPIENARVLIGATPDQDAFDSGAPSPNFGETNSDGVIEFADFGSELRAPLTVTAAYTDDFEYFTVGELNASDVVIALRPLAARRKPELQGRVVGLQAPNFGDPIELASVNRSLRLDALVTLGGSALLEERRCVEPGGQLPSFILPANVYLPEQCAVSSGDACFQELPERSF